MNALERLCFPKHRSSAIWATVLTLSALVLGTSSTPEPRIETDPTPVQIGARAPGFDLARVGGGRLSLETLRGRRVLLSFLNFQSDPTGRVGNPSRGQVVFLSSMAKQYPLEVVLVDATHATGGGILSREALESYRFTWHLDGMPLLEDDARGSTARRYRVKVAPTTLLIGTDGTLERVWKGFVPAQTLAAALSGP